MAEVSRVMADMWKALSTDDRKPFQGVATTSLIVRLSREIDELEAKKDEIESRIVEKRAECACAYDTTAGANRGINPFEQ